MRSDELAVIALEFVAGRAVDDVHAEMFAPLRAPLRLVIPLLGNMGEVGSVGWMFERKSVVVIEGEKTNEEQLMNIALEGGADDFKLEDEHWIMTSAPESHYSVLHALSEAKIPTVSAEIAMLPKNTVKLEGKQAAAMLRLNDALEEHDDVQYVYSNFEIEDSELEALANG